MKQLLTIVLIGLACIGYGQNKYIEDFEKAIGAERVSVDDTFSSLYLANPFKNIPVLNLVLNYVKGADNVDIIATKKGISITTVTEQYFDGEYDFTDDSVYDLEFTDLNNDGDKDVLLNSFYTTGVGGTNFTSEVMIFSKGNYNSIKFAADIINCESLGLDWTGPSRGDVRTDDKMVVFTITCGEYNSNEIYYDLYYKIKDYTNTAYLIKKVQVQ